MSQKAVEIILMRQLASYLAMPILLFDPAGNLLFYNDDLTLDRLVEEARRSFDLPFQLIPGTEGARFEL